MTLYELAERFGDLRNAILRLPNDTVPGQKPMLNGDHAVGAALLWTYLRDLFTTTPKDTFTRDEVLVLLETISRDGEMFPPGILEQVANCDGGEA